MRAPQLSALALLLALGGLAGAAASPGSSVLERELTSPDAAVAKRAEDGLVALARGRAGALARGGSWSHEDVLGLLALQLVDPERFAQDDSFRRRVLPLLPRELDAKAPAGLRDALLSQLNQVQGVDFAASDAIERAWGAVPRRAGERRVPYASGALRFDSDVAGRITTSIYSLPSFFFDAGTVEAFLSAVHTGAPERTLVALTDGPLLAALRPRARALHLRLLDTYGRPYSPWPRDPFSLVHTWSGAVRVLVRPNLQPGREEDANLGPELVQGLPDDLDRAWGKATWATAPVPFHNGQVLLTPDAAWITLHALEPRILALLGADRVPVESFGSAAGLDRYLAAADRAAAELAALYGRPVRFVHPLPRRGDLAARTALMRGIGGGAGYDLDSIVTFLPGGKALVADVGLGRRLATRLSPADLASLRQGFGLEPAGDTLAAALAAAQATPAQDGLAGFLDLMAAELAQDGMTVRRLPLLTVPVALLADRSRLSHESFLLTWTNVVVETRKGRVRAEGFSYLLPSGDQAARDAFAALGARLDLFSPLVRSIVLNGGYRCASNHLRAAG